MQRRAVPVLIVIGAALVGLAACAAKGPAEQAGAPETPSPVPITANPSALPVGDTVPTGIVIGGKEMVLYFWGTPENPFLDQAWRDRGTGAVDLDHACAGGYAIGGELVVTGPDAWIDLTQCVTPDGTLIEFGAVRADASRITSQDAGKTVAARYARWSTNRSITFFWLQRQGKPVPQNIADGPGRTTPLPAEQYPLITAYDAKGGTIASARLRPSATEQKGG